MHKLIQQNNRLSGKRYAWQHLEYKEMKLRYTAIIIVVPNQTPNIAAYWKIHPKFPMCLEL